MPGVASGRFHVVVPPWTTMRWAWDELGRALCSPIGVGLLDPRTDWRKLGYPEVAQPRVLFEGPCGGGIVSIEADPTEKCLAAALLARQGEILHPPGADDVVGENGAKVYYLQSRDGPLRGVPLAPPDLRNRVKTFACLAGIESIESAGDSVYWAIGFRRRIVPPDALGLVPGWARAFGIEAERRATVPAGVGEVAARRMLERGRRFAPMEGPIEDRWFVIRGGAGDAGFLFAIVVYIGYHLAEITGRRVRRAHLIGRFGESGAGERPGLA